jgi:hypothetical protein
MGWAKAHELSKLLTILSKLLTGLKGYQNFPSKIALVLI